MVSVFLSLFLEDGSQCLLLLFLLRISFSCSDFRDDGHLRMSLDNFSGLVVLLFGEDPFELLLVFKNLEI